MYEGVDFTPTYKVDYIWSTNDIDSAKILEIADLTIYGQDIPQSMVVVENIPTNESNVILMGLEKGRPTIKISLPQVDLIKFKATEEEYEQLIQPNSYITVLASCNKNEFMGVIKPQLIVEDYDYKQKWIF